MLINLCHSRGQVNNGQEIGRQYSDGTRVTMVYDANGNRTQLQDTTGNTNFVYDELDRTKSVTNPDSQTVTYGYDAVGNRTLMINPDAGRFTYSYDNLYRVETIQNPEADTTGFVYDDANRPLTKNLANGSWTSFTYDAAGQMTSLAHLKSDNSVLAAFTYTYDKTGNRTQVVEATGDRVTWTYDDTYQLTREHRSGTDAFNVTYTYDPVGNRLTSDDGTTITTYVYDEANRTKTADDGTVVTTYTFDAAGNQRTVEETAGVTTYTWDINNQNTGVEKPNGDLFTFTYNGDLVRVQAEDPNGTTKFVYDQQNVLLETDDLDATQVVYTLNPQEFGNLISRYDTGTADSDIYHYDAIGSTVALTDSSEVATDSYIYYAFGKIKSSSGTTDQPFQWVGETGYYAEPELDRYHIRRREFGPDSGRFLSEDPVRSDEEQSLYNYVRNNTPNVIDPEGLEEFNPKYSTRRKMIPTVPRYRNHKIIGGMGGDIGYPREYGRMKQLEAERKQRMEAEAKQEALLMQAISDVATGNFKFGKTVLILTRENAVKEVDLSVANNLQKYYPGARLYHRSGIAGMGGPEIATLSNSEVIELVKKRFHQLLEEEKSGDALDQLQTALELFGLFPIIGNFADAANALIYSARGKYFEASLSIVALVPVIGQSSTLVRLSKKADKVLDALSGRTQASKALLDSLRHTSSATEVAEAMKNADSIVAAAAKTGFTKTAEGQAAIKAVSKAQKLTKQQLDNVIENAEQKAVKDASEASDVAELNEKAYDIYKDAGVGKNIDAPTRSAFSHLHATWYKQIDSVVDDLVANGRPRTIVLGEGGQGKIASFVNRDPRGVTEFLELRPKSLDYSAEFKAGKGTAAMGAETLEFNLALVRRLHQRGFTFEVMGDISSSSAATSSWLKAELEVLESLGANWKTIPKSQIDEVMKLKPWGRPRR